MSDLDLTSEAVARDALSARLAEVEAERDALIAAGLACCSGTPNPTIPRLELALSFIRSVNEARKAADMVWKDYKTRAESAEAALATMTGPQTSGGERQEFSRVGHHLHESSWHVHLAGFRSQDEAEAFLAAMKGEAQ